MTIFIIIIIMTLYFSEVVMFTLVFHKIVSNIENMVLLLRFLLSVIYEKVA